MKKFFWAIYVGIRIGLEILKDYAGIIAVSALTTFLLHVLLNRLLQI